MASNPPEDMAWIVPYLYYEDANAALEFMEKAFGFDVDYAVRHPDSGAVLNARVRTGSGVILVGPGMEPFGTRGTPDADLVSCATYVFVDDVDAHFARAKAAGAHIRSEPGEHFGGNRQYVASDPGGHRWIFATPVAVLAERS